MDNGKDKRIYRKTQTRWERTRKVGQNRLQGQEWEKNGDILSIHPKLRSGRNDSIPTTYKGTTRRRQHKGTKKKHSNRISKKT